MATANAKTALMDAAEAGRITSRIRLLLDSIADSTDKVVDLILEAKDGDAHVALGFKSWPAYVAEHFGGALSRLDRADRGDVVAVLSATGMSTRSIAAVTGTSLGTAHNDIVAAGVQPLNTSTTTSSVTGIDGKTYSKTTRPRGRTKPKPITDRYAACIDMVTTAVRTMLEATREQNFPGVRPMLCTLHEDDLGVLAEQLHEVRMALFDPRVIAAATELERICDRGDL